MRIVLVGFLFCSLVGCSSINYYSELISGHMEMVNNTQETNEILQDKKVSEETKRKLKLVQGAKQFAFQELKLPQNDSYSEYVDLKREYVLWNVVAAPELSLNAYQSCFLIVGCMNYRGFFIKDSAEKFAEKLRAQGYDTAINGVAAYSTLGWFDDPVINTMMRWRDTQLVGLIFHELTHQKIYIDDDTTFNESLAVMVQHEGIIRWLSQAADQDAIEKYKKFRWRRKGFLKLVRDTHNELKQMYDSPIADNLKREKKRNIFEKLLTNYASLKEVWGGYRGYDKWFSSDLNNGKLSLVSTYNYYVAGFNRILKEKCQNNIDCFYREVENLSQRTAAERLKVLVEDDI